MITKLIDFVKKHWLVLILGFFTLRYFLASQPVYHLTNRNEFATSDLKIGGSYSPASSYAPVRKIAPTSETNRLVIKDTSLSLQVKDVATVLTGIQSIAQKANGFLVNYNLSSPESVASGNISIRVPSKNRDQVLADIQALGVKTVSLSVVGTDVTDQFVDNQARLKVLLDTKAKFEEILNQASQIQDLLNVQRELINLQSQIDNLKGQQQYLEKSAELSLISVYLSTDELALPYAPTDAWRPAVVFKEAVRSLIGHLRFIASSAIWLGVYSPFIALGLVLLWWLKRRKLF
jgi:hypothetical protein